MPALQVPLLLIFPALNIVAALKDLTSFTIPNWLCASLAAAWLAAALAVGAPLGAIGLHLAVGAGGLALGMGLFALGWIGGGDAKLLAASALWLGWPAVDPFLLYTALAGGVLAVLLLGLRSRVARAHTPGAVDWINRLATPGAPAPYGVAIACGALAAFPQTDFLKFAHLAL